MASLKQLLRDLANVNKGLKDLEEKAPRIAGVEAVKWIHKNFEQQAYKGKKWKPRSPKTNKSYDKRSGVKGSVFNSANPILRQTGNLFDSIRYRVVNRFTFVGFNTNRIPYGEIHNEGGRIMIGQKSRKLYFYKGRFAAKQKGKRRTSKTVNVKQTEIRMPKRQFMPKPNEPADPDLLKAVGDKIDFERNKVFNIFKR